MKNEIPKQNFLTSKYANFIVMSAILTMTFFCTPVFADALTDAQSLLSKAATAGGGLWAVWGIVQLGINIRDHQGPGISGAIWQIIGGGLIMAGGLLVNQLDLSMATTTATTTP